jgi:ArsR family transcriptional regulator
MCFWKWFFIAGNSRRGAPWEEICVGVSFVFGYFAKQPKTTGAKTMDPKTRNRFTARANILKALAHPSRLYMVEVLEKGARCVADLQELVGADISTVSKHLSVLRNAGIVSSEKQGNQVFYSLRMGCVMGFFDCVEAVLEGRAAENLVEDLR